MKFKRGNTKAFCFARRYKDTGEIIEDRADQVYFTVKRYPDDDEKVILQKTVNDMIFDEDGYYHITILPSDTEDLNFGKYYYDIKVIIGTDYKKTIKLDEFVLTEEVTNKENEV